MNCIQKQQLVSFPKVRIWKPWFRHFNNHKEFHNEGTVHLFSLMALFSYANFRSNERMISGVRYMEAPGQWICKLGSLPRILRVHSKRQALEQLDYYEKYGFLTYEWLDKENEIIRFSIINWKEHCTSLQYNYYSYKGSGFFFFPLPVGRMLLRVAHKTEGIVFSELDAIMDMWLHTILNDPKVRGSEYMPVVYYLYTKESIMKFSNTVRRREVAFMIRLLTIFGVVEQRQMRLLFDHMSNRSYGQILARLRQEGLAYFSPDGQFLATSRYSLDHGKTQEAIMAFWAFIQMRDHVLDFCASEPPAILSFSSADKDYDLISGSQRNIPSINASRTLVPEASVRLIVVDDMKSLDELIPRDDNDYGVLTGSDGVEQIYKL